MFKGATAWNTAFKSTASWKDKYDGPPSLFSRVGATGATGPAGATGATGAPGPAGAPGASTDVPDWDIALHALALAFCVVNAVVTVVVFRRVFAHSRASPAAAEACPNAAEA